MTDSQTMIGPSELGGVRLDADPLLEGMPSTLV
jgi:hypothetical protein